MNKNQLDYIRDIKNARENALAALVDEINAKRDAALLAAFEAYYKREEKRVLNKRELAAFLQITQSSAATMLSAKAIDSYVESESSEAVAYESDAITYARFHARKLNDTRKRI